MTQTQGAGRGGPASPSAGVRLGKALIRGVDELVDRVVLVFLVLLLALGVFSLYDSSQVYACADAAQYSAFKPEAQDTVSFDQLLRVNPEVVGWLTVNDTPIDYPLVQGPDNRKYLDRTVEGEYRLSGSIFLDWRNDPSFGDFNTIIYGHHMEEEKMFGSLSEFGEHAYFDAHPFGNLYCRDADGQWRDHGLAFFAVILTDAYNFELYNPGVSAEDREAYLDHIYAIARDTRTMQVGEEDRLVLLSTCTTEITNGRYVLVGKLTDTLHPQTTPPKVDVIGKGVDALTHFPGILFWFVAALSLRAAVVLHRRRRR